MSTVNGTSIGKHVRAFTADTSHHTHAEGKVIAYTPEPTVIIEDQFGTQTSWLARLCEHIDPPLTEPGIWGVVRAACVHSDQPRLWFHHPDGNWWEVGEYKAGGVSDSQSRRYAQPDDWSSLIAPELVRDGVAS